ncbi:MAG: hypothetical protein K0S14_884 [Thermomicrobiales bacterium]|jgi:hypothetical protein|nr:hypothetical protein [Thermomicrobiales bacterium]
MTTRQYRCRSCGWLLPAWLVAAQRPNGAMLRHHLADMHPSKPGLTSRAWRQRRLKQSTSDGETDLVWP